MQKSSENCCNISRFQGKRLCIIFLRIDWIFVCFRVNIHTTKRGHTPKNGGMKMNAKVENQIARMKNQTVGVEVEMNSIAREQAARTVAKFFGTTAWNAASEYGYCSWACKDTDGSLEVPKGCQHCRSRE